MDQEELAELAASIRENGIIQPLIVSPANEPDKYILIAGERRLLAAKMAGLVTVPVIVREASDQQHLELALIENVQRADLTPPMSKSRNNWEKVASPSPTHCACLSYPKMSVTHLPSVRLLRDTHEHYLAFQTPKRNPQSCRLSSNMS
jgi:hypothetical protein